MKEAKDLKSLEELRVKYLGRKGELTNVLRSLKNLSLAERKKTGLEANALKKALENLFDEKIKKLQTRNYKLETRKLDITHPGTKIHRGHFHPLTKVEENVRRIFASMNFSVVDGPEVETEHYNFDALNIPANHPARDMWDTFWLRQNEVKSQKSKVKSSDRLLMRTHTSPVQIRYMESHNPPFQIIVPGRVFRYEAIDAGHEINFHQLEGLMVGPNINLSNFKFVVEEFFKKFFSAKGGSALGGKGEKVQFRYRPSYFPFVEPGLEVDIKFKNKSLEVMGAGMVHRKVFEAVRYNPNTMRGFAFGMGLDRLAMIKYSIPDIRLFYSGDLRFIKQF
ncbi:MAG: phenylalanine--tRNA ligase subunit alpha [Patescibacteria group bacterium]